MPLKSGKGAPMSEEIEKKKPGPAPTFGPRKQLPARVDLALAAEFEHYCAVAGISVTEGIQRLITEYVEKKKRGGQVRPPRPKEAGPAPKAVTITALVSDFEEPGPAPAEPAPGVVSIARGSPPAKDSPWPEISKRLKSLMGDTDAWDIWISDLKAVAFEHCRLLLHCPSPFFVEQFQAKSLDDVIAGVAEELCGEPIKVLLEVDPEFEARQKREEEQREASAKQEREAREREAKERPEKIERLKALYLAGKPEDAKKAEEILFSDIELLSVMAPFIRKQIEGWIDSAKSGATYQAAKEANYKGPKRPGRS